MTRRWDEGIEDWLLRPIPWDDAQARHMWNGIPFGRLHEEWKRIVALLEADSKTQLWSFCSPPETWTGFPLRGMEGYAVVREGKVIQYILTAIS
jgi:hypothetical protein